MTLFLEVSGPWQWRPWTFRSRVMVRFGWGPLAVGWLRISFPEFAAGDWRWLPRSPTEASR